MVDDLERLQRGEDIDARIKEAADEKQASDAKVQDVSQDRLKEILRLDPSGRFEHIDDVDLIPEHRRELLRSLEAANRSQYRAFRLRLRFGSTWMVRRMVGSALLRTIGLTALGLGLYLHAAASNDGRPAVFNQAFGFNHVDPDGQKVWKVFQRGWGAIVADHDSKTVIVRVWKAGSDYITVPVPKEDFDFKTARSASPFYDVILDVPRLAKALWAQPDPTRPQSWGHHEQTS